MISLRRACCVSVLATIACTPAPGSPSTGIGDASLRDEARVDLPAASAAVTPAISAPPAMTGCSPQEHLYGTTCCRSHGGYTTCRGPNVGAPCKRKDDCDVMCGCDDPKLPPPMQGSSPQGPADGTTGAVGRCMGQIVDGAWYCVIDEQGRVTHFIRD